MAAILSSSLDRPKVGRRKPMKWFGIVLLGLVLLIWPNPGSAQRDADADEEHEVTAALGPWMILTTSYQGPEGRSMARKLVIEMRKQYNLPAYIYDFANPEREKERQRVAEIREKQRKWLAEHNVPADTPIRIRTRRFEDQYGVLIGGYKDFDTAADALKKIKKLDPPNPKRVPLHCMVTSNPIKQVVEQAWVNPFHDAFVVRNPKVKYEAPPAQNKPDPFLKQLNENEDYNLLKCPKRFTLAVAQFRAATILQPPPESNSILKKLGLGGKDTGGASLGAAALNAHNVAELLRKWNFDAYVLHMRYGSIVTVGNFDEPDDAQLKAIQNQLARMKLDPLPMLNPALPMEIPRPE
jgi:hypothetical protein